MTASINASTSSGVVVTSDTSGSLDIQSGGTTKFSVTSSGVSYTPAGSAITSGTTVASTSGTSIDFTSIPSWVKRITVMFNGVSTNGSSQLQIQIGNGSFSTSGYASGASYAGSAGQYTPALITTGLILEPTGGCTASALRYGSGFISLIGSNTWVSQSAVYGTIAVCTSAGTGVSPALGGSLDRVRITTVNGTDTFDAGSINILYE